MGIIHTRAKKKADRASAKESKANARLLKAETKRVRAKPRQVVVRQVPAERDKPTSGEVYRAGLLRRQERRANGGKWTMTMDEAIAKVREGDDTDEDE